MSPHSEVTMYEDSVRSSSTLNGNSTNGHHVNGTTNGYTNGANGHTNGHSNNQIKRRTSVIKPSPLDSEFDLVCVGFGPASLAIAVALHDALSLGSSSSSSSQFNHILRADGLPPKVLFVEKQGRFAWHAGMLLPGAKMQISFIKDLATLRDPRSEFTFLNYLHQHDRLVEFSNLSTFLPARVEYEDYMRWCASFFEDLVSYGEQVTSVSPEQSGAADGVRTFTVKSMNTENGATQTYRARNVLIATGGSPSLPREFPVKHPRVIHSSQYAYLVPRILTQSDAPYRVAVVGAGQSAAEIFANIQKLYPNSKTSLIMRQEFLRPSDDSPFVNSVFNPEYIDALWPRTAEQRNYLLTEARATNYGVVRLELIEALYETMYDQRRELGPDQRVWPHRIMGGRQITSVEPSTSSSAQKGTANEGVTIKLRQLIQGAEGYANPSWAETEETIEADLVIAATGYLRNAHVDILRDTWEMLPQKKGGEEDQKRFTKPVEGWTVSTNDGEERKMAVGRDYAVRYQEGSVAKGSGIWLQGCCEGTHGLSDTLLSVLATRGGEMVNNIFGSM